MWVFRLFLVAKWVSEHFHLEFHLSAENHSFVRKQSLFVFIDIDPMRWTGRLSKPRCGLRNILPVTDLLPKGTSASGLEGKMNVDMPGRPTASSHFAKGKLFLTVLKTLCRAKVMTMDPGWTDTICWSVLQGTNSCVKDWNKLQVNDLLVFLVQDLFRSERAFLDSELNKVSKILYSDFNRHRGKRPSLVFLS